MSNDFKNEPIVADEQHALGRDKRVRSIMMWCSIVAAIIVIGSIAYIYGYRNPNIAAGNEAIAQADNAALFAQNDSLALQQYEEVAAKYSFDAANRAKLQSAILLYQKGDYEQALSYLSDYDPKEEVIGATALGLKGDCLVNLDKYAEALKAYDSAISQSDKNPLLVPYFLMKKAHVYEAQGEYAQAAKAWDTIDKEYPEFAMNVQAESHRIQAEALDAQK